MEKAALVLAAQIVKITLPLLLKLVNLFFNAILRHLLRRFLQFLILDMVLVEHWVTASVLVLVVGVVFNTAAAVIARSLNA